MQEHLDLLEKNSDKKLNKISAEEIAQTKKIIADMVGEIESLQDAEEKKVFLEFKFGVLQNNILHLAAKFFDDVSVTKILQIAGNDKNYLDSRNHGFFTPLHIAAQSGAVAVVKILLDAGCDKNPQASQENRGWVPIHYASQFGYVEIAQFLIESGVDKETKTGFGLTPLVIAAEFGQAKLVEFLLKIGADKNVQTIEDNHRMNALHYAAIGNHIDVLLLLLDAGIDVNKETDQSLNTLEMAAKINHAKICFILLSWGAQKMEEALKIAKQVKAEEVVKEIELYVKAKKNLFDAKWLKNFAPNLILILEKFDKNNLGEAKIIISPEVSFNAYGILALKQSFGLIKKTEKTLLQFAEENKIADLAEALRKIPKRPA